MFPLFPGGLFRDLGGQTCARRRWVRGQGPEAEGCRAEGLLATQGQLRQRHGLMGEALGGQHGEGVTWGAEANRQPGPTLGGNNPSEPPHSLSM